MELISLQSLLLLSGLLIAYYVVGRFAKRWQWTVLLAGSIAFYGVAGSWPTLLFLLLVAFVTWGSALLLGRLHKQDKAARKEAKGRDAKKAVRKAFTRKRRLVLAVGLVVCLGILGYFKYWNVLLFYVGAASDIHSLGILLPLGMSFYIFQSLGYLLDVYNDKYEPEHNYARFLLFVSYFPQIIQGPINHFGNLSSQLFEPHTASGVHMERGLLRLGLGVLKKVAIANVLSNAVSTVFDVAAGPDIPGSLALYGVLAYAIQMYADFSGGIDIVEGISELFGIEMEQNFRQPYFSTSLAEFWRRWHMSLGAWMRDHVFYPLAVTSPSRSFGKWAGKHFGRHAGRTLPACVANIIVFLFVGLWHGAEMHYLAWGLYNGVVVALSDLCSPLFDRLANTLHVRRESKGFYVFGVVRTFAVVCIGRYFDRFARLGDALHALRNTFLSSTYASIKDSLAVNGATYYGDLGFPPPVWAACAVVLIVDVLYERGYDVRSSVLGLRLPVRIALYVAIVVIVAAAAGFDTTSGGGGFLYANF